MKKAARLSSTLLARKGFASPAAAVPMFGKAHRYGQGDGHHHIRDVVYDHVDPEDAISEGNDGESGEMDQVDLDPNPSSAASPMPGSINGLMDRVRHSLAPRHETPDANTAPDDRNSGKMAKDLARDIECCKGDPSGKRVAMTLRLDQPRHLRLRVLSAHINRSSQEILTEALDSYLDQFAHMSEMQQCECLRRSGDGPGDLKAKNQ